MRVFLAEGAVCQKSTNVNQTAKTTEWNEPSLTGLIDSLMGCHCDVLERAMPKLQALIESAPAGSPTSPRSEVVDAFRNLRGVIERHLQHEDKVVFNLIKSLDESERLHVFHCKSIGRPIGVMVHEHKNVWAATDRLRHTVEEYVSFLEGNTAAGAILEAVNGLEEDLRNCFEAEEQIVFPRAIAREALLASRG